MSSQWGSALVFDNQLTLAKALIKTLEAANVFEQVNLIGSVSEGCFDSMSDIDLVIVDHDRAPWQNVELASKILRKEYGSLLQDWSGSLIPDKYLISQFIPNCDIMWWVDIGCYPDARYDDITRSDIVEEWNTHIATLLVMNAKHYLRGTDSRLRITELYEKAFNGSVDNKSTTDMFLDIRGSIDTRLLSLEFVSKMDAILERVVAK